MSFSDGQSFWQTDLSTRLGAETAADQGGLASYIIAGLMVLSAAFTAGVLDFGSVEGVIGIGAIGIQAAIAIVAGFRLKAGKGAFWGTAIAILVALDVLARVLTLTFSIGLIFTIGLLYVIIQGVRGAFALRRASFVEDEIEVFE